MSGATTTESRIAELRNAFDQTYAVPPSSQVVEQMENLLAIRVSGDPYAIRLGEISGLANGRKIVAFPSPIDELLGVAGIRGEVVPVYSLCALLGYKAEAEQTGWLVLCGTEEPFALAFSGFEGYVRVRLEQVYAAEQETLARAHVKHVVRAADIVRAVVSIPDIREAVQRRCGNKSVSKER
jgi:purine-binding chemotaxis protein CheW